MTTNLDLILIFTLIPISLLPFLHVDLLCITCTDTPCCRPNLFLHCGCVTSAHTRYYTICSSPHAHPHRIHIASSLISQVCRTRLEPGDTQSRLTACFVSRPTNAVGSFLFLPLHLPF